MPRLYERLIGVTPQTGSLPARLPGHAVGAGRPWPMGASFDGDGVNFAVFSAHAETDRAVPVLRPTAARRLARLPIRERDGDIWHIHVGGLTPGTRLRLSRAWALCARSRATGSTRNKLLLDPYARALEGRLKWSDALMGYKIGQPARRSVLRHPRQRLCRAEIGGDRPVLQLGQRSAPRARRAPTR